jgi:light-harvesting complex I chlorophyll a/b binding protein 1
MMFLIGTFGVLNTPIVGKSNLPGDIGFDPLNLASLDLTLQSAYNNKRSMTSILNDYRDAELKHGRLAMLASVAWPLQEKLNPVISEKFNLPSLIQNNGGLSPSLINGGLFKEMIPNFVFMFFILSSMLETYGIQLKQDKSNWIPGDYGWRVTKFSPGSKQFFSLQEGEIWNSRIAMLAITIYVIQEYFSKIPVSYTIPFW